MPRRLLLLPLLAWATLAGCGLLDADPPAPRYTVKLVPDSTVFVVATLEAAPDTTHHHPQVYVGYLLDPLDFNYQLLADPALRPGDEQWLPMTFAQVAIRANDTKLKLFPDETATVSITGPLGDANEQTVTLQHERRGVYGDLAHALPLVPGGHYRLDVRLADGRAYTARTSIPALPTWVVPDTVRVPVELIWDGNGYFESGVTWIEYQPAPDAPLTVWQWNTSLERDREVNALEPGEELYYVDRGHFLREGGGYFIDTHGAYPDLNNCGVVWTLMQSDSLRHALPLHLRLSQINPDLARYYRAERFVFSIRDGEPYVRNLDDRDDAVAFRDTTYFRRISNIDRVGPDGQPLPRAQSDAVGVFGGYSSRYAHRVMAPARTWDPDTLDWRR